MNLDAELALSKEGVFMSMSGEHGAILQGKPCIFVRLAGCNLQCPYCDADFSLGRKASISEVWNMIKAFSPVEDILITGGEPLLQMDAVATLCEYIRYMQPQAQIQIETNGTIIPPKLHSLLHTVNSFVVDMKDTTEKTKNSLKEWVDFVYDPEFCLHTACLVSHQQLIIKAVCNMLNPESLSQTVLAFSDIFKDREIESNVALSLSPIMPKGGIDMDVLKKSAQAFTKFVSLNSVECRITEKLAFNVQLHKILNVS